jgi:citrate synthase
MKPNRSTCRQIRSRNEPFVTRTATRIWQESPSPDNPYLAENCRCHGYDLLELIQKRSFADVVFLLLRGELPTTNQATLFETLLVALINPGPRHSATRAAMNAGVGKTNSAHILPIALSVLGGNHLGGNEVTAAMSFLRKHRKNEPAALANELLINTPKPAEGDWHVAPGFGTHFGAIDPFTQKIVDVLKTLPAQGKTLDWSDKFATALHKGSAGWLVPGVAAAVFLDLGFHPRAGAGLFQIASTPGLLAHGLELAKQSRTAMPFLDDDHYIVES